MSPALLYLLLAATPTPTTPPTTITPTPTTTEVAPMAQAQGNQGLSGSPSIQFPIRHPNQPPQTTTFAAPGPAHRGAATGYPRIQQNSIPASGTPTPTEHTNRPR